MAYNRQCRVKIHASSVGPTGSCGPDEETLFRGVDFASRCCINEVCAGRGAPLHTPGHVLKISPPFVRHPAQKEVFYEKFEGAVCLLRRGIPLPRALAVTAVLIAINITLDLLNIRIQLTPQLRIGFGFLTSAMVGMLFGPVVAMTAGAATDLLGWLVNNGGGAYFPGFTLTAVLAGLIWGVALYKNRCAGTGRLPPNW